MRVKIKSRFFVVFLTVMILFPAICFLYEKDEETSIGVDIKSSSEEIISGVYDGNMCTMGLKTEEISLNWTNEEWKNVTCSQNQTYSGYEYNLNRLDIKAYNIYSDSGDHDIANDSSFPINISGGNIISQEFTAPTTANLSLAIETINLYLEHNIPVNYLKSYFYIIDIYNETFGEVIVKNVYPINPEERTIAKWKSFEISSNILYSGLKYNIIYAIGERHFFGGEAIYNSNTWKAQNKTESENLGITRYYNGTDLIPIVNDTTRDMLCNFTYQEIINPNQVDLKYMINGQEFTPIYQKSLSTGTLGYEAVLIHYFETTPIDDVNVTIYTNTSVSSLEILVKKFYTYTINSSGIYSVNGNTIDWTIIYPYYDIDALGTELWFLYEKDWNLQHFYNTLDSEMLEVYFGPMTLYNESYYGLFDLWGTPLEIGNCTGMFQSPNYCNDINSKIQTGSIFMDSGYLQLGKTVKLEAEIRNALDKPISGGTGNLTLRNPSGDIIYHETNLTSNNGILNSSEFFLQATNVVGTYEIDVFWTNGREIAFYTMQVEMHHPEGYIPPEIFIILLAIVGLSFISIPIARTTKKRIQQRNWEKTLHNLFVLSKDGVPLYDYTFGIEVKQINLITGMISALTTFMKEATGSKKGVRTIDQQDKKIILNHGEHTTIAMVCEKDLPIIHNRINKFTREFERYYGKRLVNWNGGTAMFKYTEKLITKYFPVSVEDQVIRGVRQKLIEFRERLNTIEDPKQIISIIREITEFASRYHQIINMHSSKNYSELIKLAEEKIRM